MKRLRSALDISEVTITATAPRPDRREDGFTLIELLLVTVIIGILSAIAIPSMLILRVKAQNAAAATDLRHAAQAEESWLSEPATSSYTLSLTDLEDNGLRRSRNVQMVGGIDGGNAFCLAAAGTTRPEWRIFDSKAGGMRSTLYSSAAAAMASCSDAAIAGGAFTPIY